MPAEKTIIEAIGAYEVRADEQAHRAAMECHGDAKLAEDELSSLALVELRVRHAPRRFTLTRFWHGALEQAPYAAVYFDAKADEVIARDFAQPGRADFRVCFYLHFYDPAERLHTPYGDVALPAVTPVPDRLRHLHYEYFD